MIEERWSKKNDWSLRWRLKKEEKMEIKKCRLRMTTSVRWIDHMTYNTTIMTPLHQRTTEVPLRAIVKMTINDLRLSLRKRDQPGSVMRRTEMAQTTARSHIRLLLTWQITFWAVIRQTAWHGISDKTECEWIT